MKRKECKDPNDWRWITGFEDDRYVGFAFREKFKDEENFSRTYKSFILISSEDSDEFIEEEITKKESSGYIETPEIQILYVSDKHISSEDALYDKGLKEIK